MRQLRGRVLMAAVGATALAALAACSGGGDEDAGAPLSGGGSDTGGQAAPAAPGAVGEAADRDAGGAGVGAVGDSGGGGASDGAGGGRDSSDTLGRAGFSEGELIYTAELTVRVDDAQASRQRAAVLVAGAAGVVAAESSTQTTSTTTFRVPPQRFDAVLNGLGRLGKELDRRRSVDDVTEEVADVESRLATQRASVARVRALLAEADTLAEVVTVEAELTKREAALESLQARARALADQVDLATIVLQLVEREQDATPAEEDTGFLAGLAAGWDAFSAAVLVVLTALGALLPFLLVLVPAAAVALTVRARRRAGHLT